MKITIITPCYNAEDYIEDTILSIINQCNDSLGNHYIEHIICDGSSQDRTVEIAERFIESKNDRYKSIIISEPDKGMYDALAKGLKRASGDIISYLNAGDLYEKGSFISILNEFKQIEVDWVTGRRILINEENIEIRNNLPYKYRNNLLLSGVYGKKIFVFLKLPFIQQESTFWRKEINKYINLNELSKFKLAGDYFIWSSFAQKDIDLKIIDKKIGKFKIHDNQLSSNRKSYESEVSIMSKKPNIFMFPLILIDLLGWIKSYKLSEIKNKKNIFKKL
ncbi:glycosyltransferase [Exiguobacterium sp. s102]|uniref:glycosyltransferase n=1 Tax=Exiguobacterium sp. s102 TaxID=2751212 RepID=UPI001BE693AB|nr:glycosyltransferase [Exiguobacterium sp. s102]